MRKTVERKRARSPAKHDLISDKLLESESPGRFLYPHSVPGHVYCTLKGVDIRQFGIGPACRILGCSATSGSLSTSADINPLDVQVFIRAQQTMILIYCDSSSGLWSGLVFQQAKNACPAFHTCLGPTAVKLGDLTIVVEATPTRGLNRMW
jgi:hypothetical protein